MKFLVDSKEFFDVATVVAKSINPKEQLAQTTFELSDGNLTITHYCGVSYFSGKVEIRELEEELEETFWSVSGNQFKTILSVIPREVQQISFSLNRGESQFTIQAGGSKLKLPLSEAPVRYLITELEEVGTVEANFFFNHLQSLCKVTMTETTQQIHPASCVHLIGDANQLVLMATSGIALAEKALPFEGKKNDSFSILLKPQLANLLLSSAFNGGDTVMLYENEHSFGYINKNQVVCLVSKTQIAPLEYQGLKLAVGNDYSIQMDAPVLQNAVDSVSRLCNNQSDIILTFDENQVKVENTLGDQIVVPGEGSFSSPCKMAFQRSSFHSLFGLFSERIQMNWKEGTENLLVQIQLLNKEEVDSSQFLIMNTRQMRV